MRSKIILIAGIAIIVLGTVWYTNFRESPVKETINTTTVDSDPQSSNKETTFVVKELGIQFTITEDIKDLVYVTENNSDLRGVDVYFSTQGLIDADKKAGGKFCTRQGGPELGVIFITTPAALAGGAGAEQVKQFGSKYLYYNSPQDFCSANKDLIPLVTNQLKLFRQALNSAVLLNQDAQSTSQP